MAKKKPAIVKFAGPWTMSKLRDFETCRLQFKFKFVEKREEKRGAALMRGERIHTEIERYLTGRSDSLPESVQRGLKKPMIHLHGDKRVVVEKLWAHDRKWMPLADMWDASAYVRGKTDAAMFEPNLVRIIDFKTGKIYPENKDQLLGYGIMGLMRLAVRHGKTKLAKLKALLENWYIDQDQIIEATITGEEVADAIEDLDRRAQRIYDEIAFPAEPGVHCRWCSFRRMNGGPCAHG